MLLSRLKAESYTHRLRGTPLSDDLRDPYRSEDLADAVERSLNDRDNRLKAEERHTGTPESDATNRLEKLREGYSPLKAT